MSNPETLLNIRQTIKHALGQIKDQGTAMDSGFGVGGADVWVTVGGAEYHVSIKPSQATTAHDAPNTSA